MRIPVITALVGTTLFLSGCTVASDLAHYSVIEPAHYPTNLEHCRLQAQARKAADKAWLEVVGEEPICKDFEIGFKDGYADYLQYGGTGEPPSIPPRQYWAKTTPDGRQAGVIWSQGFRRGSAEARQSGLRELITVPLVGPGVNWSPHEMRSDSLPVLPIPRAVELPESSEMIFRPSGTPK